MKEKEILRIGYEELKLTTLYRIFLRYYRKSATILFADKEKVKEIVKEELAVYYLKSILLQEPIHKYAIIDSIQVKKKSYKIVTIPQKELDLILLKNKLGGYLNFIVQEKEFDAMFEELYPKILEHVDKLI